MWDSLLLIGRPYLDPQSRYHSLRPEAVSMEVIFNKAMFYSSVHRLPIESLVIAGSVTSEINTVEFTAVPLAEHCHSVQLCVPVNSFVA